MKGPNLFPLVSHLAFSQHNLQCREILGIDNCSVILHEMFAYYFRLLVKENTRGWSKMSTYEEENGQGSNSSFPGPSISVHSNPRSNQTCGNASTSTASLCLQ